MMKRLLGRVVISLLLLGLLPGVAQAQGRIATVDLRKLFDGYWKTKRADAQLKDQAADMEKEDKNMRDDLKKANEEYQTLLSDANNQVLSAEEREKRKKSAEDKLKQLKQMDDALQQYGRQARTTLDEKRKRLRDNLLEEIRATLNSKAKSSGYGLIIDSAAETVNGTPVVIYASQENDLTEAVLLQLNANAPPEPLRTDEPKEEKKDEKKKGKK